jgi:hypothetical protein
MRRRPEVARPTAAPVHGLGPPSPRQPTQQGDIIEAFLVSGGQTFFLVSGGFDPRPNGVQLVRALYVPKGRIGFVKQLRVAPFMPTVLVDPWETKGIDGAGVTSWRDITNGGPVAPGGKNGVWETPFGWESYFDPGNVQSVPPQWSWLLRLLPGNIDELRAKLPPFSFADPTSWFLLENIAVPIAGYPEGLPGAAPTGYFRPERMQVLQGDALVSHVVVPPDTTILLFVRWTQQLYQPRAFVSGGEAPTSVNYGDPVYPLLPSFGQLHGYVQAADRDTSAENAYFGWGG